VIVHWRLIQCVFGRHSRILDEDGLPRCAYCHIALSLFNSDPSLNPDNAGAGYSGVSIPWNYSTESMKEWWKQ
jgi:hypothetical protein